VSVYHLLFYYYATTQQRLGAATLHESSPKSPKQWLGPSHPLPNEEQFGEFKGGPPAWFDRLNLGAGAYPLCLHHWRFLPFISDFIFFFLFLSWCKPSSTYGRGEGGKVSPSQLNSTTYWLNVCNAAFHSVQIPLDISLCLPVKLCSCLFQTHWYLPAIDPVSLPHHGPERREFLAAKHVRSPKNH
jgi:hypothetical protein